MKRSAGLATASCPPGEHAHRAARLARRLDKSACQRAADVFRALGDPARMQILSLLAGGELCVSELAQVLDGSLPAVSQRLKLLRSQRIVSQRREGKHVFYSLADRHIAQLIANGLAHADEP
jgi:ArsR family transcriptional regulator